MTSPNLVTVRGRYARIEMSAHEGNPDASGLLTIVNKQEIEIPIGLLDYVGPSECNDFWNNQVVVTCQVMPHGALILRDIEVADEPAPYPTEPYNQTQNDSTQPPLLVPAGVPNHDPTDSAATRLLKTLAQHPLWATQTTLPSDMTAAQPHAVGDRYRYWMVTMPDGSTLEINPVPASDPAEPWLWAVVYAPDSDLATLAQGAVCHAIYDAVTSLKAAKTESG